MHEHDICYAPLTAIAGALQVQRISSRELTELFLARIRRLDPTLKAYATVTDETALEAARRADEERAQGRRRSLLHGIPVAVKDLCFARDTPAVAGMPLRREIRPDQDGTVVRRLREAGAVVLGLQTMTEGATFHHHPDMPRPTNPWRADLWPGVSSSGSAVAAAAGLCCASIGSDTGGSIRFPSACNGLTGLKPTWGRVSRFGAVDNAPTWDTLGPMARSAADAAVVLDAIAGYDPLDPTSLPETAPETAAGLSGVAGLRGLRIGVDRSIMSELSVDVARLTTAAEAAMADLGVRVRDVTLPGMGPLLEHIVELQLVELAAAHAETYPAQADRYGAPLREALEQGRAADPLKLGRGLIERRRYCGLLARLFEEIDVLLMPVLAGGTPSWDEAEALVAAGTADVMRYTGFANACGIPSLTLPCGETPDGRPVGFQLVGAHGSEVLLLRAGHAFQQATGWHAHHPALG